MFNGHMRKVSHTTALSISIVSRDSGFAIGKLYFNSKRIGFSISVD